MRTVKKICPSVWKNQWKTVEILIGKYFSALIMGKGGHAQPWNSFFIIKTFVRPQSDLMERWKAKMWQSRKLVPFLSVANNEGRGIPLSGMYIHEVCDCFSWSRKGIVGSHHVVSVSIHQNVVFYMRSKQPCGGIRDFGP